MITIQEIDKQNVVQVNQCDGRFMIDAKLDLRAENGAISYTLVNVPPYEKRYACDDIDYTTYLGQPDKTAFLAYVDDQLAGQINHLAPELE